MATSLDKILCSLLNTLVLTCTAETCFFSPYIGMCGLFGLLTLDSLFARSSSSPFMQTFSRLESKGEGMGGGRERGERGGRGGNNGEGMGVRLGAWEEKVKERTLEKGRLEPLSGVSLSWRDRQVFLLRCLPGGY